MRPEQYRGIGRYALNADYGSDPGWQWSSSEKASGEEIARKRLAEILGVNGRDVSHEVWLIDGPWLVPNLDLAKELIELLENPSAYEIVEMTRYPSKTSCLSLGFDVGYWASGNFSCEGTAQIPSWTLE
ncbi:MAG TPA: hypothetical protein VJ692_07045 [Nitrospiraceae bacterium]|nr:hypothetical protein [Nitrospiraceae bacterium]